MAKDKTLKTNSLLTLYVLTKRNVVLFLKNRMTVFFSLLAPVIILVLYVMFLGDMQIEQVLGALTEAGVDIYIDPVNKVVNPELISYAGALINNWMIAGVLGVSCLTVALNANIVMVRDKANGSVNDMLSSPIRRWIISLSYILACFIITLAICTAVYLVSIVYLLASGGFYMSVGDFFAIFGILVLSVLSSSFGMVLIGAFVNSTSSLAAINGVFGAAIGFFIGAYLPFSMLPGYMQNVAAIIPGTYSAGLLRTLFMGGVLRNPNPLIPQEAVDILLNSYSIELNFFGYSVSAGFMAVALIASIVIFAGLLTLVYSNKKGIFFHPTKLFAKRKKAAKTK